MLYCLHTQYTHTIYTYKYTRHKHTYTYIHARYGMQRKLITMYRSWINVLLLINVCNNTCVYWFYMFIHVFYCLYIYVRIYTRTIYIYTRMIYKHIHTHDMGCRKTHYARVIYREAVSYSQLLTVNCLPFWPLKLPHTFEEILDCVESNQIWIVITSVWF